MCTWACPDLPFHNLYFFPFSIAASAKMINGTTFPALFTKCGAFPWCMGTATALTVGSLAMVCCCTACATLAGHFPALLLLIASTVASPSPLNILSWNFALSEIWQILTAFFRLYPFEEKHTCLLTSDSNLVSYHGVTKCSKISFTGWGPLCIIQYTHGLPVVYYVIIHLISLILSWNMLQI